MSFPGVAFLVNDGTLGLSLGVPEDAGEGFLEASRLIELSFSSPLKSCLAVSFAVVVFIFTFYKPSSY